MPALPVVPGVIALDMRYATDDDAQMQNRTFWQYAGAAPNETQITDFAGGASTNWSAALQGLFNTGVTLMEAVATDLSSPIGAVGSDTSPVVGTRGGPILPLSCCAVISFEIGRRYRGGHPRNYMPAGSQTDQVGDRHWDSAFVTDLHNGYSAWAAGVAVGGWAGDLAQVNVSYYSGYTVITLPSGRARNQPNVRATPQVDAISSYIVRSKMGSQRKRLGKPF